MNFWTKNKDITNLEELIQYQNQYLLNNADNPAISIEMAPPLQREDAAATAFRKVTFKYHPDIAEHTGFIDFENFVIICVLFCRNELEQKNLRNLRFVIRKVFKIQVSQSR